MDIKDLNKSQLILLAILLSFVTSIATGITTVTLMQQAPPSVVTPINRIVQQTVEKIQQVEGKTTVKTVVVKEEDLVVDAISKNKDAVFTVTREVFDPNLGSNVEVSAGSAFAVSGDGMLVADGLQVTDNNVYSVKNSSGKFKTKFISGNKGGFSFLKAGAPLDEKNKLAFTLPVSGDVTQMKVGQKIIILGSSISSSILNAVNEKGDLDISVPKGGAGGLVLNIDGEALGIALSGENSFASIKSIKDALAATGTPQ